MELQVRRFSFIIHRDSSFVIKNFAVARTSVRGLDRFITRPCVRLP